MCCHAIIRSLCHPSAPSGCVFMQFFIHSATFLNHLGRRRFDVGPPSFPMPHGCIANVREVTHCDPRASPQPINALHLRLRRQNTMVELFQGHLKDTPARPLLDQATQMRIRFASLASSLNNFRRDLPWERPFELLRWHPPNRPWSRGRSRCIWPELNL